MKNKNTWLNKTIAVVGMGKSGRSVTVLASLLGAKVMCFDSRTIEPSVQDELKNRILSLSTSEKRSSFPTFHTGHPIYFHNEDSTEKLRKSHVGNLDLLILSPGVPASSSWLIELQNQIRTHCYKELSIASEVGFAASCTKTPIIAITGTNGKSSCSWYTHQYLSSLRYRSFVGGNFGTALSEMLIEEISNPTSSFDFAVVEISSYQMEFPFGFAPKVGVILNLTPDHLARHKTMEVYAQMKQRIFTAQSRDDFCLYPLENTMLHPNSQKSQPLLLCAKKPTEGTRQNIENRYIYIDESSDRETQIIYVHENKSTTVFSIPPLQLLGRHNLQNIQAMIGILHSLSLPVESHLLSSIRPLEHRLEIVDTQQEDCCRDNTVEWINDSKATNVEATLAGLSATIEYIQRKSSPVTLIILLGGAGKKGAEYRVLFDCITNVAQPNINIQILCFGASGQEIKKQLQEELQAVEKIKHSHKIGIHIQYVKTMSDAVSLCHSIVNGEQLQDQQRTVLLSPACASFDEFENFEHRGRIFCELIQNVQQRNNNITNNTTTTSTTIRLEET